jgi:hypothetical protein
VMAVRKERVMAENTRPLRNHPTETLPERHAWKVLLSLSVIVGMFGVSDMMVGGSTYQDGESVLMQGVTGTTWQELQATNPRAANLIDLQVRGQGATMLVLGLLSAVVCLTGFRRGERWAWYAMWIWPLWSALAAILTLRVDKVPGAGIPVPAISGSLFVVLSMLSLVLSYRKYFPGQR